MPKEETKAAEPAKKPAAHQLPQVEAKPVEMAGIDACKLPDDADFKDGIYLMGDEPYALCVHEVDGYGRTHSLKNSLHTWQGTEEQFNAAFKRK